MSAGWIGGILVLAAGPAAADPPPPGPVPAEARRDALARYGAGVWQARRNRLLTAAREFEAASRRDPEATAPLKELLRTYTLIGREPDAIRVARTILERSPRDADAAHALARLLSDAGELAEAVGAAKLAAEYTDAARHPEKAVGVYRDLATLLDRAGDPAAAAALGRAVEILAATREAARAAGQYTPKDADEKAADTYERLGGVLVKQKQFDAAVAAFRSAHALYADPTRAADPAAAARLAWNLSAACAARGDPAAALAHLETFLKHRPRAVEPYERLAALLTAAGRGGDAVPLLQRAAAADPGNLPLQAVLAAARARDPDGRRQADADFARLTATAADPAVLRVAVRSFVETGRPGHILDQIDRAYRAVGDDPEAGKSAAAAAQVRVIGDVLRADPEAAVAVLRAGADDLRAGTARTHQTWLLLGNLAARHHKLDLAAVQFRQAVRNAPGQQRGAQAEAYTQLIMILWKARKPAEVAIVCRDGLRDGVSDLPVAFNYHLARALAELGDGDEAVAAADAAIRQAGDANRLVTRLQKATVFELLGRWDEAAAACRKLLDEFDAPADQAAVRYALAGAYWGAKQFPAAEAEYRAVLAADPDHAGACNDFGYHLADQGRDLDEADRLVRHAIAVDRADRRRAGSAEPENAAFLDSLGWVLFKKGRLADARAALESASGTPDGAADPVVWDHLGDVLFRAGERAKAKAAWEKAADLYATYPRGRRDGRPDEVRRKLKRAP